ncbi:enolase C-terminal domain-like protein [Rhodospirillaceae bacterium SYSU D60014]|uniref:mandelate racemase/muconate lactonizing enzyme family protein n=1 Tax=Virgifigura deserti TaxID=2268457 RepID=UPI000E665B88
MTFPDPKIAIRDVDVVPLRIPFAQPFTFAAPHESMRDSVEVLLVRLHTDAGLVGIGETQAWRRQGSFETLTGLHATITQIFKPILVGRSPFDVGAIMQRLAAAADHSLYAQAAIGDALYDLMGKALGVPVYQLLGGRCRDTVPVGLALSITAPDAMVEQGKAAFAAGYRHLRIKIGLDPALDVTNVRRMREHFGDDVVLRADANGGLSFSQALPLLKKLEPFDLDIIEQPVPGWDLDGMAALASSVSVPLSADESLNTDHSLVEIVRRRAAAVVQTKTGKNGGIHGIRRLWAIAQAAGIGIFPGNHPGTSVATAAVAQTCIAWPGPLLVGDFQTGSASMLGADIVREPIRVVDGSVRVPDVPGLGVEIDEAQLKRFRIDG